MAGGAHGAELAHGQPEPAPAEVSAVADAFGLPGASTIPASQRASVSAPKAHGGESTTSATFASQGEDRHRHPQHALGARRAGEARCSTSKANVASIGCVPFTRSETIPSAGAQPIRICSARDRDRTQRFERDTAAAGRAHERVGLRCERRFPGSYATKRPPGERRSHGPTCRARKARRAWALRTRLTEQLFHAALEHASQPQCHVDAGTALPLRWRRHSAGQFRGGCQRQRERPRSARRAAGLNARHRS